MKYPKTNVVAAFTLIELSIVLVIIGLIVGGILVGQSLVESATVRKVATEFQQYKTAYATFKGKYDCIPGDCAKATMFFGSYSNCPTGGTGTGTCNGNGEGYINGYASYGLPVEGLYAWQQLSLAGLIPGKYPGGGVTSTGAHYNLAVGSNIPASSYNPAVGYMIFTPVIAFAPFGWGTSAAPMFDTVLQMGSLASGFYDFLWGAGLTAPQTYQLDSKIDDGLPSGGTMQSMNAPGVGTNNPYQTCLSGTAYSTSPLTGCTVYWNLKVY